MTNTNKPLYKQLKNKMPEIKFDVKAGDKNFMRIVGYNPNAEIPKNFEEMDKQEEQLYIAGKYSNLAVNNLHHLAEALERINSMCADSTPDNPINIGKIAQISMAALKNIY